MVGGHLHRAGLPTTLVARGAHLEAIRDGGLRLDTGDGMHRIVAPATDTAADVAWDEDTAVLLAVKSHQAVAALDDEIHVAEQRARYGARRDALRAAVEAAGFRIDHSEAGLYLWVMRDEPSHETAGWFADRGVVVVDGASYGPTGGRHVRLALTTTDEAVGLVTAKLAP